MPRDKTASHKRVLESAKKEFLSQGFEAASIREIAQGAGMTSAGLYRHCKDKEDLLGQLLQPLFADMNRRFEQHTRESYAAMRKGSELQSAFDSGEIKIFHDLALSYPEEMKLLLCKSSGSHYENFLHKLVNEQQVQMMEVLAFLSAHGYPVISVSEKEMHVFLSAFVTAIVEPIVHDYNKEEMEACLTKTKEFFTPGWMNIMGL